MVSVVPATLLFSLSALLALIPAYVAARRSASAADDRVWIMAAVVSLELGLIANALSPFHALEPAAWLVAQALIAAAALHWARVKPVLPPTSAALRPGWFWLAAIGGVVCIGGALMALTPIFQGDEKMYHASRVLYWIQNRSVFPYITHNDRQVAFSYQGELFFLWPVLFTRMEVVGRMLFWLMTPLTSAGLYMLLARAGASRVLAGTVTFLFVSTPLVLAQGSILKPELWTAFYSLGAAYWLLRAFSDGYDRGRKTLWSGVFLALAMSAKFAALFLVPVCLLAALLLPDRGRRFVLGFVSAALLSGLLILFVFNERNFGNPLGSQGLRGVVTAEFSAEQFRVHVARSVFMLLEPPALPFGLDQRLSPIARKLNAAAGAMHALPMESAGRKWPGAYRYALRPVAHEFGFAGTVALIFLLCGAAGLLVDIARRGRQAFNAANVLMALALSGFCGTVFVTRWMHDSDVPQRFLLPALALTLAAGAARFGVKRSARWTGVFAAAVVLAGIPPVLEAARALWMRAQNPLPEASVHQPFGEVIPVLPQRSRLLVFCGQDAPDYPLFGPGNRYDKFVVPWGKGAFDAARLHSLIEQQRLTHILIAVPLPHFVHLDFHWDRPQPIEPILRYLDSSPQFQAIAVPDPLMHLYWVRDSGVPAQSDLESRYRNLKLPPENALVLLAPELRGRAGLGNSLSSEGYGVEILPAPEGAFLWLGSGEGEGAGFSIWLKEPMSLKLEADVSPGPSRTTPARTLRWSVDGAEQGSGEPFDRRTTLTVPLPLTGGIHHVLLYSTDTADIERQANGDARHLLVGVHELRIAPR
jgi:hypothetical protein